MLGGFEQAANSVDKNLKKSTGTLKADADFSNHEVVIVMESVCGSSNKLTSDALWWQEDKYTLQPYAMATTKLQQQQNYYSFGRFDDNKHAAFLSRFSKLWEFQALR